MITLAKGNRSKAVVNACKKHGGFYLGSIGGPAAILGRDCIKKVDIVEYPELGMEVRERTDTFVGPSVTQGEREERVCLRVDDCQVW